MTLSRAEVQNFSQGLDLVSSLNTMPSGYTQSAKNFRIAEYGGIEKVAGYTAFADLGTAGLDLTYFQKRDDSAKYLVAGTTTGWQSITSAGTVTVIRSGMTTETDHTFAIYEDVLYGMGINNPIHKWTAAAPGTATTALTATVGAVPAGGILLGVWEDSIWVAVTSAGTVGVDIVWSDPGDPTSWTATNTLSLGGSGTADRIVGGVPTGDGLVVFTTGSTYIITDSETGANNVVDQSHGCSSRRSLTLLDGNIYGVNAEGVFVTNGRFPLTIMSRRIDPIFHSEVPTLAGAAGVAWGGSLLLSFGRAASATNNATLDIYTRSNSQFDSAGSIMLNDYRMKSAAAGPLAGLDKRLYFIDAGNTRYVRRGFDGGSFLTTATPGVASDISCFYETPPLDLGTEYLKRLRRLRLIGRGPGMTVGVKTNYSSSLKGTAKSCKFTTSASASIWDTMLWDSGTWAGYQLDEGFVRLSARARRFSLRFEESSQNTFIDRRVLDDDGSGVIGAAAIYLIEPEFTVSNRRK